MGTPLNFEPQPGVYFVSNVGFTKNPDGTYSVAPSNTTVGGSSAVTTRVNSTAYEASHVLKASAGSLVSLIGYNSGSAGFIQLFDSATVPADGSIPVQPFAVPGTGNFSLDVAVLGMPFSSGITVVYSTTAPTKTIGNASVWLTAVVK